MRFGLDEQFDRFQQRAGNGIGALCGSRGSGLLTVGLSLDEDGLHAQPLAGLMSESESPMTTLLCGRGLGKVLECLFKEPSVWFSALAFAHVMRTVIDRVQPRAMLCQVSSACCCESAPAGHARDRPKAMPR